MLYGSRQRHCAGNRKVNCYESQPGLDRYVGVFVSSPAPKGWYSAFYPDKKTKGFDELKYYSQIFNTCEINNTFYRPPSAAVAQGWVTKTPDDFTFVIKLWQKFTHPMKISRNKSDEQWEPPSQADFDEFRTGILPLAEAGKLGALLLQYPAGFHYSPENLEKVQNALRRFYDYPKVVELRHQSWSERNDQTKALLDENRASSALIDEPKFATSIRQDVELSVRYFISGRTAETQKLGGITESHGNATIIFTRALRSKNWPKESRTPPLFQE